MTRRLAVALPLIMLPSCLHEQGTINNAKVLPSMLTLPSLSYEQRTINNAKAPSFALPPPPSFAPPLPPLSSHEQEKIDNTEVPLSLPSCPLPLLTSLRKQRGSCTTLSRAAALDFVLQAEEQSSALRCHCCYSLMHAPLVVALSGLQLPSLMCKQGMSNSA
jgi:hypothetical protein